MFTIVKGYSYRNIFQSKITITSTPKKGTEKTRDVVSTFGKGSNVIDLMNAMEQTHHGLLDLLNKYSATGADRMTVTIEQLYQFKEQYDKQPVKGQSRLFYEPKELPDKKQVQKTLF